MLLQLHLEDPSESMIPHTNSGIDPSVCLQAIMDKGEERCINKQHLYESIATKKRINPNRKIND